MRNLPLPSRDAVRNDLVKAIRTYRYKGEERGYTASPEEIDAILDLYDNYDQAAAAPNEAFKGAAFPQQLSDTLHNSFDLTQASRKLSSVRKQIFAGVALCPMCGIAPAKELDHYLPRSAFKPLSIYPRNLIPLCHHCNHIKSAGFGEQDDAEKRLLHAYFDAVPDLDFLAVNIEIQGHGLLVEFAVNEGLVLPNGFAERFANQLTTLKLNERYRQEVSNYLSGHAVSLHLTHRAGAAAGVRRLLSLQARFELRAFYRNHWRPTLLSALAQHDGFVNGGFADVLPIPTDMIDDLADAD